MVVVLAGASRDGDTNGAVVDTVASRVYLGEGDGHWLDERDLACDVARTSLVHLEANCAVDCALWSTRRTVESEGCGVGGSGCFGGGDVGAGPRDGVAIEVVNCVSIAFLGDDAYFGLHAVAIDIFENIEVVGLRLCEGNDDGLGGTSVLIGDDDRVVAIGETALDIGAGGKERTVATAPLVGVGVGAACRGDDNLSVSETVT